MHFADMLQIAYRTVEVSPLTKKQIKWADYKKVPVVVMDGEAYGDSSAVITRLAAELRLTQQDSEAASQSKPSRGLWPFGSSKSKSAADIPVGVFCSITLLLYINVVQALCEIPPDS